MNISWLAATLQNIHKYIIKLLHIFLSFFFSLLLFLYSLFFVSFKLLNFIYLKSIFNLFRLFFILFLFY